MDFLAKFGWRFLEGILIYDLGLVVVLYFRKQRREW